MVIETREFISFLFVFLCFRFSWWMNLEILILSSLFLFEIVKMWMIWEILNWACLSSVIIRIHITHRSYWDYCRDSFYVFFRLWWWVKLEISLFKIIIYLVYHKNYIQSPCFQYKICKFRTENKVYCRDH